MYKRKPRGMIRYSTVSHISVSKVYKVYKY